ncbi:Protein of unknown function, partial [Cotesia congregata]
MRPPCHAPGQTRVWSEAHDTDLFGFELLDGHLYLHIDLGSGYLKKRVSKYRIDNSTWHDIALSRIDRRGKITVDEELSEFETI